MQCAHAPSHTCYVCLCCIVLSSTYTFWSRCACFSTSRRWYWNVKLSLKGLTGSDRGAYIFFSGCFRLTTISQQIKGFILPEGVSAIGQLKALWRRAWFVCRVLDVDWRRNELVMVMVVPLSNACHLHVRHNIRTRNRVVCTELSKRITSTSRGSRESDIMNIHCRIRTSNTGRSRVASDHIIVITRGIWRTNRTISYVFNIRSPL